jgi:lantibiotic transport system permease protein
MSLIRALHAETLKLKRTLAFRMVFVAPLLVAILLFFIAWNQRRVSPGFNLWEKLPKEGLGIWAVFMLPLLITLETALMNSVEHGEKQWKHLFALPIRRDAVYFAKLLITQAMAALSTLILCGLMIVLGLALIRSRPELSGAGPIPFGSFLKQAAMIWLASGLIISIHSWVSIRWPGVALALGVGIGGTFFALFAASARLGTYYPWLLPFNALNEGRMTAALWLGAAGGVVAAVLGCLEFVRRDVV